MTPTHIAIHIRSGECDCDCCGSYSWADASIELPNGSTHKATYDGHFGGGIWDGNDGHLHLIVLGLLGIVPQIDGVDVDMPQDFSGIDDFGSPSMAPIQALSGQPILSLPITIEWSHANSPLDKRREPLRASWRFNEKSHTLEMGSALGYDDLWLALCGSVAIIEIEHEREAVDPDDIYDDWRD